MATTTNYGWTTPDDTALVKDGAAAIRTLGSSVDTTTKALNPSTTLGDIEYRSSTANTNTRLGIGTTGQVLTVAGGVPSWAAAGGGLNYTLINAGGTALTGAGTITISGISNVENLLILVTGGSTAGLGQVILRLNSDSGSNYAYQGFRTQTNTASGTGSSIGNMSATSHLILNVGSTTDTFVIGTHIFGCKSTGFKAINNMAGQVTSADQSFQTNGIWLGSAAVTSVSLTSTVGNWDAGTVYVYGG